MTSFFERYQGFSSEQEKDNYLKDGINELLDNQLRQELESDLKNQHNVSRMGGGAARPQRRIWIRSFAVAASLAVCLLAARFIFFQPSADKLAAEFLSSEVLNHPGVQKGVQKTTDVQRAAAIAAFDQQEYLRAIDQFTAIENRNQEDAFYLALSHTYAGNFATSIDLFHQLGKSENTYQQEINWHLSLALLLSGDEETAKAYLISIKEAEWKYVEAQKLLARIK